MIYCVISQNIENNLPILTKYGHLKDGPLAEKSKSGCAPMFLSVARALLTGDVDYDFGLHVGSDCMQDTI